MVRDPSKKVKMIDNGIIIIWDVGKNVAEANGKDEKTFFDKSRECVARIIERKILSQGKDHIGIILLGSMKTINNMAKHHQEGAYKHIETFFFLQLPTWKIIRDLPEFPSQNSGDWVEALAVAVDLAKNEVSNIGITNVKILLITNFQAPTHSNENIQMVLKDIKNKNIEVDVIGTDINDENNISSDIERAREFVEETNGVFETFDSIKSLHLFNKKKNIKPQPWDVDLSIGPYIKIPVTSYLRLNDDKIDMPEKNDKRKKKIKRKDTTSKSSAARAVVQEKVFYNVENQSVVEQSDVIQGHKFGGQTIPSSETDKLYQYKPGGRSLSLYGFTLASKIHWQHLDGKGLFYMFGRKGDKKAQLAIKCLRDILHENKLVGIVRKVYKDNNVPNMFTLMPVIDINNNACLSMACLCYKEAIKYMSFPPTNIRKYTCTKDQVNAFKDLIKEMNLKNGLDDSEAFPAGETVNPYIQYNLDCFAYRALNPEKPLPLPRDDIMELFKIPPLIQKRCQEAQEKIKNLFPLQKVEVKMKRTKRLLHFDTSNQPSASIKPDYDDTIAPKIALPKSDVPKRDIGTINPVRDFSALIDDGKSLADLAPDMTDVIESLLYYNLDGAYIKSITTMAHFRNECVKIDPLVYNNWLLKFKVDLSNRNRSDLLCLIKEKSLDFILKSENNFSTFETIDSHEESYLYEIDTVPESTEVVIKPDVYDMFNDI